MGQRAGIPTNDAEYTGRTTRSRTAAAAEARRQAYEENRDQPVNNPENETNENNDDNGPPQAKVARSCAVTAPNQQRLREGETPSRRRGLIDHQNRVYDEALRADREKERQKKEKAKSEQERQESVEKLKHLKQEIRKKLEEDERGSRERGDDTFTLMVRLPSGRTAQRNFRSTDSLHVLRQFVFCQDEAPTDFDIIRYPNHVLPIIGNDDENMPGLDEYGITRREVLYIRPKKAEPGQEAPQQSKRC